MHAGFIHACINSCIHWFMLVHSYTYIHTFMHAGLIYSLIHSFIHPGFIHSYSCMQAWFIQSYIYACMHTASFIYSFIHAGDSFIHESIDSKSLTFIYTGFIHSCMVHSFIYSTRNTVSILISFIVCVATSTSVGIKVSCV